MDVISRTELGVEARCVAFGLSGSGPDALVVAASTATELHWGVTATELIGRPFSSIVEFVEFEGDEWEVLEKRDRSGPYLVRDRWGSDWFLTLTVSGGQTMAHLESVPRGAMADDGLRWCASAIDNLSSADSEREVWDLGCEKIRRTLGFDRTMVVRLGSRHTEVVAESCGVGGPSLVGSIFERAALGVQGADIRGLPLSVSVSDIDAGEFRLVPESDNSGRSWDMSKAPCCYLSERQRVMMRRFGARSSFAIVLKGSEGDRGYMVISYSAAPRMVDAFARLRCEVLARFMFDRVASMRRTADLDFRLSQLGLIPELVSTAKPLVESLTSCSGGRFRLLEIVPADGAIVRIDGEVRAVGDVTPDEVAAVVDSAHRWAQRPDRLGLKTTENVSKTDPELGGRIPDVAGILGTAIGSQGSFVCWIRRPRAVVKQVAVAADPREAPGGDTVVVRQERALLPVLWNEADRRGAGMLVMAADDQLLRSAQARLAELALVDPLTGLPNRRLLVDRMSQSLRRQQRGKRFLVCFIDLNDFKSVNDTMGHRCGDRLLIAVADRLGRMVRSDDTVARLGGDEFVVLCDDVQSTEADAIEARIRSCFDEPFDVDGVMLRVGAAVGVTLATGDDTVEALLDRADASMYSAKASMKSGPAG